MSFSPVSLVLVNIFNSLLDCLIETKSIFVKSSNWRSQLIGLGVKLIILYNCISKGISKNKFFFILNKIFCDKNEKYLKYEYWEIKTNILDGKSYEI